MSRHQSGTVIHIVDIHRIAVKACLFAAHAEGRRIHQSPDGSLSLVLQGKTAFIYFPFPYPHGNVGLGKDDIWLWNMKVSFGKTLNLILQIRHLLQNVLTEHS